ncbi:cupin domain-containing protein [Nocardiopsis dassonvillei]|uniref:cupin domain-containing protein n=1 Tax=Nocardiopsis dassonvillei TaxID=2014 RepID=UPI0033F37D94
MFDELGEPAQRLTSHSPSPLVMHKHMSQLTVVAEGAGLICLDGSEMPIKKGDLAILSETCPHSFRATPELILRHWHWPQELLETDRLILDAAYQFSSENLTHQRNDD